METHIAYGMGVSIRLRLDAAAAAASSQSSPTGGTTATSTANNTASAAALFNTPRYSYLSSPGSADPRLLVRKQEDPDRPMVNFDRCVFRLEPVAPPIGGGGSSSSSSAAAIADLMGPNGGIVFGRSVRIVHSYSGLYVAVVHKTALMNPQHFCLQLMSKEAGGAACRFRIRSKYKRRGDGDAVRDRDIILLTSETNSMGLTMAAPAGGEELEATASDAPTPLEIRAYDDTPAKDEYRRTLLRAGLATLIFHREKDALLVTEGRMGVATRTNTPSALTRISSRKATLVYDGSNMKQDCPVFRHFATPVTNLSAEAIDFDCSALWFFDRVDPTVGGPIYTETLCRLRHGASGKYLCAVPNFIHNKGGSERRRLVAVGGGGGVSGGALSSSTGSTAPTTTDECPFTLMLQNLEQEGAAEHSVLSLELVQSNDPLLLSAAGGGSSLGMGGGGHGGNGASRPIVSTKSYVYLRHRTSGMYVITAKQGPQSSRLTLAQHSNLEDTMTFVVVPEHRQQDLTFLIGNMDFLNNYVKIFRSMRLSTSHLRREDTAVVQCIERARVALESLIFFCTESENGDVYKREGLPIPSHQSSMFEIQLHRVAMDVVVAPFIGDGQSPFSYPYSLTGGVLDKATVLSEKGGGGGSGSSSRDPIHTVCRLAFRLLKQMAKGSEYASLLMEYVPFMQQMEGSGLHVADTLREIVTNNPSVPHERADKDIEHNVKLLLTKDRSSGYIQHLTALCCVNEAGMTINQTAVANKLFKEHRGDILFPIYSTDGVPRILVPPAKKKQKTAAGAAAKPPAATIDGGSLSFAAVPQAAAGLLQQQQSQQQQQQQPQWWALGDFLRGGSDQDKIKRYFTSCIELVAALSVGSVESCQSALREYLPHSVLLPVLDPRFTACDDALRAHFFNATLNLYIRNTLNTIGRRREDNRNSCGNLVLRAKKSRHQKQQSQQQQQQRRRSSLPSLAAAAAAATTTTTTTINAATASVQSQLEQLQQAQLHQQQQQAQKLTDELTFFKHVKRFTLEHLEAAARQPSPQVKDGANALIHSLSAFWHTVVIYEEYEPLELRRAVGYVIAILSRTVDQGGGGSGGVSGSGSGRAPLLSSSSSSASFNRLEFVNSLMGSNTNNGGGIASGSGGGSGSGTWSSGDGNVAAASSSHSHSYRRRAVIATTETTVVGIRTNQGLCRFLSAVLRHELARIADSTIDLFVNVSPARAQTYAKAELASLCGQLFVQDRLLPVLRELMWFEDRDLVNLSLQLALDLCNAHAYVADRVRAIHVVAGAASVGHFQHILTISSKIRKHVSPSGNIVNRQAVMSALRAALDRCDPEGAKKPTRRERLRFYTQRFSDTVALEYSHLLGKSGLPELLITTIEDSVEDAELLGAHLDFFNLVCVADESARLMADHIGLFCKILHHSADRMATALIILALLRCNKRLASEIDEETIRVLVSLLQQDDSGALSRGLEFIVLGEFPILKNQKLVLDSLITNGMAKAILSNPEQRLQSSKRGGGGVDGGGSSSQSSSPGLGPISASSATTAPPPALIGASSAASATSTGGRSSTSTQQQQPPPLRSSSIVNLIACCCVNNSTCRAMIAKHLDTSSKSDSAVIVLRRIWELQKTLLTANNNSNSSATTTSTTNNATSSNAAAATSAASTMAMLKTDSAAGMLLYPYYKLVASAFFSHEEEWTTQEIQATKDRFLRMTEWWNVADRMLEQLPPRFLRAGASSSSSLSAAAATIGSGSGTTTTHTSNITLADVCLPMIFEGIVPCLRNYYANLYQSSTAGGDSFSMMNSRSLSGGAFNGAASRGGGGNAAPSSSAAAPSPNTAAAISRIVLSMSDVVERVADFCEWMLQDTAGFADLPSGYVGAVENLLATLHWHLSVSTAASSAASSAATATLFTATTAAAMMMTSKTTSSSGDHHQSEAHDDENGAEEHVSNNNINNNSRISPAAATLATAASSPPAVPALSPLQRLSQLMRRLQARGEKKAVTTVTASTSAAPATTAASNNTSPSSPTTRTQQQNNNNSNNYGNNSSTKPTPSNPTPPTNDDGTDKANDDDGGDGTTATTATSSTTRWSKYNKNANAKSSFLRRVLSFGKGGNVKNNDDNDDDGGGDYSDDESYDGDDGGSSLSDVMRRHRGAAAELLSWEMNSARSLQPLIRLVTDNIPLHEIATAGARHGFKELHEKFVRHGASWEFDVGVMVGFMSVFRHALTISSSSSSSSAALSSNRPLMVPTGGGDGVGGEGSAVGAGERSALDNDNSEEVQEEEKVEEEEGEVDEEALIQSQLYLNDIGMLTMVTEVAACTVTEVCNSAYRLGIAILEGGNRQVQDKLLHFFQTTDERFFHEVERVLRVAIHDSTQRRTRAENASYYRNQKSHLPFTNVIEMLRFLQLLCEGHHLGLQDYLRLQNDNLRSCNIVRDVTLFLKELTSGKIDAADHVDLLLQVLALLTELCQGPCAANQQVIVDAGIFSIVRPLLIFVEGGSGSGGGFGGGAIGAGGSGGSASVMLSGAGAGGGAASLSSSPVQYQLLLHEEDLQWMEGGGGGTRPAQQRGRRSNDSDDDDDDYEDDFNAGQHQQRGEGADDEEEEHQKNGEEQETISEEGSRGDASPQRQSSGHHHQRRRRRRAPAAVVPADRIIEIKNAVMVLMLSLMEGAVQETVPMLFAREIPVPRIRDLVQPLIASPLFHQDDVRREDLCELVYNVMITMHIVVSSISDHYQQEYLEAQELLEGFKDEIGLLGKIEIERDNRIERVYFRVPELCMNLSEEAKQNLLWSVDRSTQGSKLSDFLEMADEIIYDLEKSAEKSDQAIFLKRIFNRPLSAVLPIWDNVSLLTAAAMNMLFVFIMANAQGLLDTQTDWWGAEGLLRLLALVQASSTLISLLLDSYLHIPLLLHKREREMFAGSGGGGSDGGGGSSASSSKNSVVSKSSSNGKNGSIGSGGSSSATSNSHHELSLLQKAVCIITRKQTFFRCMALVFSILGFVVSEFFFAFHLLGFIGKSTVLKNVVVAVTQNGKSLLLTGLFGCILVYLFSIVAFVLFQDHFEDDICQSLPACVLHILTTGLRQGGGIGDKMREMKQDEPSYLRRVLFDFFFWAFMIVIFLNILFGIIIDTFAELRDDRSKKEEDMRTKCFICGFDSYQLDRYGPGFQRHVHDEHNMWQYLYFFHHLKRKEPTEYTGQESYVAACVKNGDIAFFPAEKCLSMDAFEARRQIAAGMAQQQQHQQNSGGGGECGSDHHHHFGGALITSSGGGGAAAGGGGPASFSATGGGGASSFTTAAPNNGGGGGDLEHSASMGAIFPPSSSSAGGGGDPLMLTTTATFGHFGSGGNDQQQQMLLAKILQKIELLESKTSTSSAGGGVGAYMHYSSGGLSSGSSSGYHHPNTNTNTFANGQSKGSSSTVGFVRTPSTVLWRLDSALNTLKQQQQQQQQQRSSSPSPNNNHGNVNNFFAQRKQQQQQLQQQQGGSSSPHRGGGGGDNGPLLNNNYSEMITTNNNNTTAPAGSAATMSGMDDLLLSARCEIESLCASLHYVTSNLFSGFAEFQLRAQHLEQIASQSKTTLFCEAAVALTAVQRGRFKTAHERCTRLTVEKDALAARLQRMLLSSASAAAANNNNNNNNNNQHINNNNTSPLEETAAVSTLKNASASASAAATSAAVAALAAAGLPPLPPLSHPMVPPPTTSGNGSNAMLNGVSGNGVSYPLTPREEFQRRLVNTPPR